jgi:hypothetical protein
MLFYFKNKTKNGNVVKGKKWVTLAFINAFLTEVEKIKI